MKTAIITAYRKAGYIEENLEKLKGFDIIIAADEPKKNFWKSLEITI